MSGSLLGIAAISGRVSSISSPTGPVEQRDSPAPLEVVWNHTPDLNGEIKWVEAMTMNPDGSIILAGVSAENSNSGTPWAAKLNSQGSLVWTNTYPIGEELTLRSAHWGASDQILLGIPSGRGWPGGILVINDEGQQLQTTEWGHTHVMEPDTDGTILVGGTESVVSAEHAASVARFGAELDIRNRYTLGEQRYIKDIALKDDGFLVAGHGYETEITDTRRPGAYNDVRTGWISDVTNQEQTWETTFSIEGVNTRATGVASLPDAAGAIVCGYIETSDSSYGGQDERTGFIARVSEEVVLWYHVLNPTIDTSEPSDEYEDFSFHDITRVSAGHYVAAGEYSETDGEEYTSGTRMVAVNSGGDILWNKIYTKYDGDDLPSPKTEIHETEDGGLIVGGSLPAGVFKLGSNRSFQPATNGFDFENWETDSQTASFEPPHNHDRVTQEESASVVRQWVQNVDGFDVSDKIAKSIGTDLYHSVNRGTAANGHCVGMIYTAREFYNQPESIPADATSASEIEKPTGMYSAVGTSIDQYHNQQYFDFDFWWSTRVLRLPSEIAPIDYQRQIERIQEAIDAGETIPVALGNSFQSSGHAVLAYDYEESDSGILVRVYDPNNEASAYPDTMSVVGFDTSGSKITANSSLGYQRILTLPRSPDVDAGKFLAAGLNAELTSLFESLFQRIVQFEIQSPASITVKCPDGAELTRGQAEHVSDTATEAEERRIRYAAPTGEYTVVLTGESEGEYTIDAQVTTPGKTVLSDQYTGRIQSGDEHVFRATVSENGDDSSLVPANEGANKTATQVSTTTDTGEKSNSDGPGGMIAAGAAGVAGTLAVIAGWLRRRDTDE